MPAAAVLPMVTRATLGRAAQVVLADKLLKTVQTLVLDRLTLTAAAHLAEKVQRKYPVVKAAALRLERRQTFVLAKMERLIKAAAKR